MKKTVYIIAVVWSLITLGICFYNENIFTKGEEVLLKIVPYDPRDFLRGDYVTLHYDIDNIELAADKRPEVNYEKTAYVILKRDEKGHGTAKDIQYSKPKDELFIKGHIRSVRFNKKTRKALYNMDYKNIDRYYLKEGSGRKLEKRLQKYGGYARIYIAPNGNARVKKIIAQ